jgi:hypothetical protein
MKIGIKKIKIELELNSDEFDKISQKFSFGNKKIIKNTQEIIGNKEVLPECPLSLSDVEIETYKNKSEEEIKKLVIHNLYEIENILYIKYGYKKEADLKGKFCNLTI